MRPAARFALLAAPLVFAIVILMLNLGEKDYYERGSLAPPRGDTVAPDDKEFLRLLPETVAHPCPVCGDCTHPLVILQNRRELRIRDHDGWYKLFWAGDETYHYDDPAAFAASLRNSTARDPQGAWTIRARLGPPTHGACPPHTCTLVPGEFTLRYELVVSSSRIPPQPPLRTDTPLVVLPAVDWFSFYADRPRMPYMLFFGWRLAGPPAIPAVHCACGKP